MDTDTVVEDLFHFQETNRHIAMEMFKKKQTDLRTNPCVLSSVQL